MAKLGKKFIKARDTLLNRCEKQDYTKGKRNFQIIRKLTKDPRLINQGSVIYVSTARNTDTWRRIVKLGDHINLKQDYKSYGCGKTGHRLQDCTIKKFSAAGAATETEDILRTCGAESLVSSEIKNEQIDTTIDDCIRDNHLMQANGKSINLVMNTYQQKTAKKQMPVTTRFVGQHQVTGLLETGCSSVVVKEKFCPK